MKLGLQEEVKYSTDLERGRTKSQEALGVDRVKREVTGAQDKMLEAAMNTINCFTGSGQKQISCVARNA